MTDHDCPGCELMHTQSIINPATGRYVCPTCPSLPVDAKKPADPLRAGLGELLKRG